MNIKILSLCAILIMLLLVFNGCFEDDVIKPGIIYVDDEYSSSTPGWHYDRFNSIQDGINAVAENGTINVYNGTYYEVLSINKSINLIGYNGETTIINNPYSNQKVVVQINAESCIFKGFKVIGPEVSNDITGVHVSTSNNILSNNIVINTGKGIYLGEDTENNSVYENIATNNREGILVYRSDNNNISNNEISINIPSGISLSYGIYFHGSNDNIISGNSVSQCYTGIRLKDSDSSLVFDNSIFENTRGLYCCCGAGNNKIYHNNFEQNEEHALDDIGNVWDNGTIGNYYDDYLEKYPDAKDINGIWDIPYDIFNNANQIENKRITASDTYPLVGPI